MSDGEKKSNVKMVGRKIENRMRDSPIYAFIGSRCGKWEEKENEMERQREDER